MRLRAVEGPRLGVIQCAFVSGCHAAGALRCAARCAARMRAVQGTSWVRAAARVRVCASQQHPLAGRDAFFLQRVSRVAEQPVLLESFWFDAEVFPRFDELTLEGKSLSEATFARYRMEATSAEQRFRVEALGADESKWLELSVGNAVLRVDRTLHFATARGAAFVVMHCRTDRFEFYQTIGAVDQAN